MKIRDHVRGLLFILILMAGCASKMDSEKETKALLNTDRQFAKVSVEKGAAEAFRMYLTEHALQLPAGSNPIYGRESIYQGMLDMPEGAVLEWEPQDGEVAQSGELGWTWGNYIFSYKDSKGETKKSYGKYLNVWKKQDGKWRVLIDMGNNSPEPEKQNN